MSLVLAACTHCGHPQVVSEEGFWLKLELSCEKCFKYFMMEEEHLPLFISRIYNPTPNTN